MEQEVKLLHMAELLQQLHQMEPGDEESRWEYQVTTPAVCPRQRLTPSLPNQHHLLEIEFLLFWFCFCGEECTNKLTLVELFMLQQLSE